METTLCVCACIALGHCQLHINALRPCGSNAHTAQCIALGHRQLPINALQPCGSNARTASPAPRKEGIQQRGVATSALEQPMLELTIEYHFSDLSR
jgi:hypothetical protein